VTDELHTFIQLIQSALEHLAWPAGEQIAYLVDLGTAPQLDELALELDDAVQVLPQLVEREWLTQEQAAMITAVNNKLGEMSGIENAALWVASALSTSREWADVRSLAQSALRALRDGEGKLQDRSSTDWR
jgi:hypothetical protein